jgi:hypothetical protein
VVRECHLEAVEIVEYFQSSDRCRRIERSTHLAGKPRTIGRRNVDPQQLILCKLCNRYVLEVDLPVMP